MKCRIPPTAKRVAMHTKPCTNHLIRETTKSNILLTEPDSYRLEELDREWDTERVIETGAAVLILLSILSVFKKRRKSCLLFGGTVAAFLLHHALHGWCPPLSCIRKMGVRTAEEIAKEKFALKFLRGDFANVEGTESLLRAIEKG